MKKSGISNGNKLIVSRLILYFFSLLILVYTISPFISTVVHTNDYMLILVFQLSLILITKMPLKLKKGQIVLNDFVVIVCYFKFNFSVTIWIIAFSYLIDTLLTYTYNKANDYHSEYNQFLNGSLIILSLFLSDITMKSIFQHLVYIDTFLISIIVLSTLYFIYNYLIFHLYNSLLQKKFVVMSIHDGISYLIINFLLSLFFSTLALYLSISIGNIPIILMLTIVVLFSFITNSMNKLRADNSVLSLINDCTTKIIYDNDIKTKFHIISNTIEQICEFDFCGTYLLRENFDSIYPLNYKNNSLSDLDIFKLNKESEIFNIAQSGKTIYSNNVNLLNYFNQKSDFKYKSIIIVPIKTPANFYGCIIILFKKYLNQPTEIINNLSILGNQISSVYKNNLNLVQNKFITIKNYNGLLKSMDYYMKNKILFTLAVIELKDYREILKDYNFDFFESLKNDLCEYISKYLSPLDYTLNKNLEDIYIQFSFCDKTNANNKLREISKILESYSYKDINIHTTIKFSSCEYPLECSSKEEMLELLHRKLYFKKNETV